MIAGLQGGFEISMTIGSEIYIHTYIEEHQKIISFLQEEKSVNFVPCLWTVYCVGYYCTRTPQYLWRSEHHDIFPFLPPNFFVNYTLDTMGIL